MARRGTAASFFSAGFAFGMGARGFYIWVGGDDGGSRKWRGGARGWVETQGRPEEECGDSTGRAARPPPRIHPPPTLSSRGGRALPAGSAALAACAVGMGAAVAVVAVASRSVMEGSFTFIATSMFVALLASEAGACKLAREAAARRRAAAADAWGAVWGAAADDAKDPEMASVGRDRTEGTVTRPE